MTPNTKTKIALLRTRIQRLSEVLDELEKSGPSGDLYAMIDPSVKGIEKVTSLLLGAMNNEVLKKAGS